MAYTVETTSRFDKQFGKLDHYTQRIMKSWITKHLVNCEDPRIHGKTLKGNFAGQWRYRIGDYRLICLIEDEKLVITALSVGHRKEIYTPR